jgi:hypothetical protein
LTRPEETDLFADREQDLDRAVRDLVVPQRTHRFEDGNDSALVVTAQHGRAVGPDHVGVDDGTDVLAGDHGVHVCGEQERRRIRYRPRDAREHVAGVAADLVARVVDRDRGAQTLERRDEPLGHPSFTTREAGRTDEIEELVDEALAMDHEAAPRCRAAAAPTAPGRKRWNQARLRATASRRCSMSVNRWSAPGMRTRSQGSTA